MKTKPKTVRNIVESYLRDNGFDGLCYPEIVCGCGVDGLAPCGGFSDCRPAYQIPLPDGDPWEGPFYTSDFDHRPTEAEVRKHWKKLRRDEG